MANYYLQGVNWSSLKKFARWAFGEDNIENYKVSKSGKEFFIYISRSYYNENKEAIESFENEFFVNMKAID